MADKPDGAPRHYSEVFDLIAQLGIATGGAPVNRHVGCWEHQIDEHWWVAVNGHATPTKTTHGHVDVPPFHAVVEFNGWIAGLLTPYGGTLAAGSAANEATLIAALKAALKPT